MRSQKESIFDEPECKQFFLNGNRRIMEKLIYFIDDKEDILSEDKEVITFITKLTFERFV
jgi:hypothetical protein